MKAAIVGLGSAGARHFNNLYDFGVREFVVCRTRQRPSPRPLRTESFLTVNRTGDIWPHRPDLAVIATPTAMHAEIASEFVCRSIPVYLEKPVDASLETARTLLQQVEESGTFVTLGYQWRHHPTLPAVKTWLAENRIGVLSSVMFESGEALPDYHPWEDYRDSYAARREQGGGVILTQSHDLDLLFHLFGAVKKVFALGGRRSSLQIDVEDTALISLLTLNGVPLILRQDYLRRPAVKRLHIVGDKGQMIWDGFGTAVLTDAHGSQVDAMDLPTDWTPELMSQKSLQDFFKRVSRREKDGRSLQEGVEVLKIADAALRSLQNGEAVSLR